MKLDEMFCKGSNGIDSYIPYVCFFNITKRSFTFLFEKVSIVWGTLDK